MNEVLIRQATKDDLPFVYSTWLKSYRYNSQFAKKLTNKVYYEYHHKAIERIFTRGAFCLVACDSTDPSVMFGYLVGELVNGLAILHFIYVKKAFRGLGIMKQLQAMANLGTEYLFTHYTEFCDDYLKERPGLTYVPYLI